MDKKLILRIILTEVLLDHKKPAAGILNRLSV